VRSRGRNCLGEIAAFGPILRRFVRSLGHLRPGNHECRAAAEAIELPNFFKIL